MNRYHNRRPVDSGSQGLGNLMGAALIVLMIVGALVYYKLFLAAVVVVAIVCIVCRFT